MARTAQNRPSDAGRVGLAHWSLMYGPIPTDDNAPGQRGVEGSRGQQQHSHSRTRDAALEVRIERARVAMLAAPTADLRRARCAEFQRLIRARSAAQVAAMERALGISCA